MSHPSSVTTSADTKVDGTAAKASAGSTGVSDQSAKTKSAETNGEKTPKKDQQVHDSGASSDPKVEEAFQSALRDGMGCFGDQDSLPKLDDLKGWDTGMLLEPVKAKASRALKEQRVIVEEASRAKPEDRPILMAALTSELGKTLQKLNIYVEALELAYRRDRDTVEDAITQMAGLSASNPVSGINTELWGVGRKTS